MIKYNSLKREMGIRIHSKTKNKATLKLYNAIVSYLFEQQYDELEGRTKAKAALNEAKTELIKIIGE